MINILRCFFILFLIIPQFAFATEYYVASSVQGSGNCLSAANACQVASVWSSVSAGDTIWMADGTYSDSNSNIDPPDNLNGSSGSPITISAINEGEVLINGGTSRVPVNLYYNDYFVIEGINATGSASGISSAVIRTHTNADNNIIRRVVGWDISATATDGAIFGNSNNTGNVFEDCAGFGRARKVFSSSQGGNYATYRRCFGKYLKNVADNGPEMTFTLCYRNFNSTWENVIGTWDSTTSTGEEYGVFSADACGVGVACDTGNQLLGSIGFTEAGANFPVDSSYGVVFLKRLGDTTIENVAIHSGANHQGGSRARSFSLQSKLASPTDNVATSITSIGTGGNYFDPSWVVTDHDTGNTVNDVSSIWSSSTGAQVCYQYEDGVLTDTPLWPWPMDQRIYDAMDDAGYTPLTVTTKLEELFGTIPDACRTGTDTIPPTLIIIGTGGNITNSAF